MARSSESIRPSVFARLSAVSLVAAGWSLFLLRIFLLQILRPTPDWLVKTQLLGLVVCGVLCVLALARALRRDVRRKARRPPLFFGSVLLSLCIALILADI